MDKACVVYCLGGRYTWEAWKPSGSTGIRGERPIYKRYRRCHCVEIAIETPFLQDDNIIYMYFMYIKYMYIYTCIHVQVRIYVHLYMYMAPLELIFCIGVLNNKKFNKS